jgi:hypothetical protein
MLPVRCRKAFRPCLLPVLFAWSKANANHPFLDHNAYDSLGRSQRGSQSVLQTLRTADLESQRFGNALRDDVGVAMRPIGIELCTVIPSIAQREPVDRIALDARAQFGVE